MSLGFVVGKFYPPHRGHKLLIDTGAQQVDHLIVMVCHHPSQKIPGELRQAWLREIHPQCDIRLVPDTLEDDSEQWAKFTIDYLGRSPDVVFTSEDYGEPFARHLNCRHVQVDRARTAVPISGTKIRQSPLDCLEFLEPCVRSYFVRRVVLIGAESTGKTTLAQELAERYQTLWVPEYGREYWENKVAGHSMNDALPPFVSDEFVHIATEQQRRENDAARRAGRVLICDTNAFATGTWHERYMGHRDPRVDAIGAEDHAHLYFLTEPDFPFVQDGFRDGESIRGWMHERFVAELNRIGASVVRINGSREARWKNATAATDQLLSQRFDL